MADVAILVIKLREAKEAESRAKAARMALETELAHAIGVPDSWTGSTTSEIAGLRVTCARRDNVTIDNDMLNELINNDVRLADAAQRVFRWKPEIVKKEWDAAPDDVVKAFAQAVTRTPGKISFTLKEKNSK